MKLYLNQIQNRIVLFVITTHHFTTTAARTLQVSVGILWLKIYFFKVVLMTISSESDAYIKDKISARSHCHEDSSHER